MILLFIFWTLFLIDKITGIFDVLRQETVMEATREKLRHERYIVQRSKQEVYLEIINTIKRKDLATQAYIEQSRKWADGGRTDFTKPDPTTIAGVVPFDLNKWDGTFEFAAHEPCMGLDLPPISKLRKE